MSARVPILLSFYGLSNGKRNLFFGKIAFAPAGDLAFKSYNRLKTFRTIVALYRTRAVHHAPFEMTFDHGRLRAVTDDSGSFWCEVDMDERQTKLLSITLTNTNEQVRLTEDLYPNRIHRVKGKTIVVSDLDDTLIQSFIHNKFRQVATLLFTSVEKRKAVVTTSNLIKRFAAEGAEPFYLSNSEQNLYPMLFRFLAINDFPPGPLFLKQYVRLRHMFMQKILRRKNAHKVTMLEKLLEVFPDKKFILVGDNTQHDLTVYLDIALRYPQHIRHIIIREAVKKEGDEWIASEAEKKLKPHLIGFHFAPEFPDDLPWVL